MKRGFLNTNGPKKPKSVVGPRVAQFPEHKPPSTHVSEVGKVAVPTGAVLPLNSPPNVGDFSTHTQYIVTTLQNPLAMLPLSGEPTTAAILYDGMKEKILALPAFSVLSPFPFPTRLRPDHYHISPAPNGAGVGMFATKDFSQGDLIACDRPLLISPQAMIFTPESMHPHAMLDIAINQKMSAADREAYCALSNCKGSSQPVNVGITDTNALNAGALPGYDGLYGCVCKDISRINHRFVPTRLQLSLYSWS